MLAVIIEFAPFSATFVSMFGEDCMLGEGYAGVGEMALQQQRSQHANDFLCCLVCDGYQEDRGTGHLYIDWWQVHIAFVRWSTFSEVS